MKVAGQAAAALRGQAGAGPLEDVERWLAAQEALVVGALREDEDPAEAERREAEIEKALAPYRERMPARVLERIREDSRVRRLLERHGLPRLSLFHLDSIAEARG